MSPQPRPEPVIDIRDERMKDLKVQEKEQRLKLLKGKKTAIDLIDLAYNYAAMRGLVQKRAISEERALLVQEAVNNLDGDDEAAFDRLMAAYTFHEDDEDVAALVGDARRHG
jgi:hypothetical protein